MARERKPKNYDVTDQAQQIESSVSSASSVIKLWQDVDVLSLGLPVTMPINDNLYVLVVRLIDENGMGWLCDVMEEYGKPMPTEIYHRLISAASNLRTYSTKDFPNVFSKDQSIDIGWRFMLPYRECKIGIVILELLRDNYPAYYTEVMRAIYYALLNHD